jgi:catechol 2,3-dioxygenase-like lactoylglutathione lyase family enzyme
VKISHTHHIALFTANFDRMRDFYTAVLGFPIVGQIRGHNIVFVDCGSTAIEIVEHAESAASSDRSGWVHLALEVDDIDTAYAELSAAGVAFHLTPTSLPEEHPVLRIAFFRDPDGNELELYQPFGGRYPG